MFIFFVDNARHCPKMSVLTARSRGDAAEETSLDSVTASAYEESRDWVAVSLWVTECSE